MAKESINIGKGLVLDVDFNKFSAEVIEYLVRIGVTNVLRDCHAGITLESAGSKTKQQAESLERATAKLASMYAGEVNAHTGGSPTRDPVEREAKAIARRLLGRDADPADVTRLAQTETVMRRAKVNVDAETRLAEELDKEIKKIRG